MSIAKKVYITLLIGLFVGLLVKESIMDKQLEQTQFIIAKLKAEELKNSIMVFRDYISELNEQNNETNDFVKAHPINTVIESKFLETTSSDIKIRTSSHKPILSKNLATSRELENIHYFDRNKDVNEKFDLYTQDSEEYYLYSYALRLDQKCLSCHSDFNVGDTRGIISIYIPKKSFNDVRILLSNKSYIVTFIVLLVIFIILYFVVIKPLSKNMTKFQSNLDQFFDYINDEDDEINFETIKSSDELGLMSKKIHTNINKAKKVIENRKESHEKLKQLMDEQEGLKFEEDNTKRQLKTDRSKSVRQLLNNISANLHTPLKELKNRLQEIETNDTNNESIDNVLNQIESIDNVLAQYKFFFKKEDVPSKFKLQTLIKECNIANHFEYKKLQIDLIDDYEDIDLMTYKQELYQVLLNILSNNISNLENSKYEERLILISAIHTETNTTIEIKDNGGGFDPSELDKLFEPQIDNNQQFNINSLKLYIAKEILLNHLNGDLEVVNIDIDYKGKSFKGSEYIISLPRD